MRPFERALLLTARRGVLSTIATDGAPRSIPVCYVALDLEGGLAILTPIDEKPKATADPLDLARVRDIGLRPRATLLVDRWDEDWTRLAWVRVVGPARLIGPSDPEHAPAVAALRAKYPQYVRQRLETRPMIRIDPASVSGWTALQASAR
jgi:PPOX class probable F420-dependent enzyme